MCLVEDGLLSLKHPITDYIPEITTAGAEQILIADLLTHTSGYDDFEVYGHAARHTPKAVDAERGQHPLIAALIAGAKDAPLHGAPGAAMLYSNFGYELLGEVVRRVSSWPFEQFVERRILAPLAMDDSTLVLAAAQRERRVLRPHGYPATDDINPFFPAIDTPAFDGWPSGGAGLKTTAKDIATFAQMLLKGGTYSNRRVLSRAAVTALTTPQLPAGTPGHFAGADPTTGKRVEIPIRGGSFGYGLFISADERTAYMNGSLMSPRTFGHDGFGSCNFWADPETGVIGVYLSVMPRLRGAFYFWRNDHFQDMVHAAILD